MGQLIKRQYTVAILQTLFVFDPIFEIDRLKLMIWFVCDFMS